MVREADRVVVRNNSKGHDYVLRLDARLESWIMEQTRKGMYKSVQGAQHTVTSKAE